MNPKSTRIATTLIFQAIAFLTTVYRLVLRYRGHGLWWDDFWALTALVSDMSMVISLMIFINRGGLPIPIRCSIPILIFALYRKLPEPRCCHLDQSSGIHGRSLVRTMYLQSSFTSHAVVEIASFRLARVSLSVAIVRVSPPGSSMRRSAAAMAGLFGLIGFALLLQRIIYCTNHRHWVLTPLRNPICGLSVGVSIASVCSGSISVQVYDASVR